MDPGVELVYGVVGLVLLLVLSAAFLFVFPGPFKSRKGDTILLLGLSGAGKTSLFYQLRDASIHGGTVTSMEPNEGKFILHSETSKGGKIRPVHVVDVPGHPTLRPLVEEHLPKAQGIIFVVDSLEFVPNLRSIAEYLYEVLSTPIVIQKKIPVLIVCNKCEKVSAHSMDFIRRQLEKELDKLRGTRTSLTGADADASSGIFLGNQDEPFKLDQCSNKVYVTEASALTGKVEEVEKFIRVQVKP